MRGWRNRMQPAKVR